MKLLLKSHIQHCNLSRGEKMTASQEKLVKKILIGVVAFSVLVFLYKGLVHAPKLFTDTRDHKTEKLKDELFDLSEQEDELITENNRILDAILHEHDALAPQQAGYDLDYDASEFRLSSSNEDNQASIDMLEEQVKKLKENKALVTVNDQEEQTIYAYQSLIEEISADGIPTSDAYEQYTMEKGKSDNVYTLTNKQNNNEKRDFFLVGPWAMIVSYDKEKVGSFFNIEPVDRRLGVETGELIPFSKGKMFIKEPNDD